MNEWGAGYRNHETHVICILQKPLGYPNPIKFTTYFRFEHIEVRPRFFRVELRNLGC